MKLYFLAISFSLLLSGKCSTQQDLIDSFKTFFDNRCLENVGDSTYFEDSVNTLYACLRNCSFTLKNDEQPQKPQRCSKDDAFAKYGCFENLVEKLDACLELEERYLANYTLELFNKTFSLECDNEEKFIEDSEKFMKSACFKNPEVTLNITAAINKQCVSNIKTLKHLREPGFVLKENEICSDTKFLRNCVINQINQVCSDEAVVKGYLLYIGPAAELCEQRGN